jgi:thiol:disulfide interchange protein DsbD
MKKLLTTLLSLLLITSLQVTAQEEGEPLEPSKAFALSVKVVDAETVQATWDIAEGYYLYRSKLKFESRTDGITLGEPQLPSGKVKHDEFFGDVEVYRGSVTAIIPLQRSAEATNSLVLKTTSQGCADIGICYPPQHQTHELSLPAMQPTDPAEILSGMGNDMGLDSEGEILEPDQAFRFSTDVADGNTVIARWEIAPKHYLYKEKFTFELTDAQGVTLGQPSLPKGEEKDDEFFGKIEVYHDQVEARLPLKRDNLDATTATLKVSYQGCAEAGICYPPIKKSVDFDLPAASAGATSAPAASATTQNGTLKAPTWSELDLQDSDQVLAYLLNSPLVVVIGISIVLGLLIAFTACMYPMIPIVSSIIVGQGEEMSRGKGFLLTLVYVEAMALTFGIIGGIMGGIGGGVGLQAYFQSPWLLIPFAGLFVLLALSMFGFYEIQIPSAIQSRISNISNQQKGGSLAGVGIMGALSALIIGPCGGPMLIAMLAYAAGIGNVGEGFVALFAFGNGMGLPLLAVGLLGGELLPRAGTWMDAVKATAGVILLAVALVFLERMPSIFPLGLTTFLWAALFIIAAVYMGALEPFKEGGSGWTKLRKGVAVIIMIYGAIFMLASLTGGSGDLTSPLHGSRLTAKSTVVSGTGGAVAESHFTQVKTVEELKAQLSKGQPVMLDFYADWCTYCKTYEKYVFSDPAVAELMGKFNTLQADVTLNDADDKALLKHAGVYLPPAILFFDANGKEMREFRVVGEMEAEDFAAHLNKVLAAL